MITVYSTPTCHWCHKVKAYFTEQKIEFTDYDVSVDDAKATEMVEKTGQMGVPVIDIDGEIIIGFDKVRIDALLAKQKK